MIHVVFQQADVEVLKKAQDLDETLAGTIFHTSDLFRTALKSATACASTALLTRTLASARLSSTSAYLITGT